MSGRVGFCNGAFIQPVTRPRDSKWKQLKEEKKATRMDNDIKETLGRGGRVRRSRYSRVKAISSGNDAIVEDGKGRTE